MELKIAENVTYSMHTERVNLYGPEGLILSTLVHPVFASISDRAAAHGIEIKPLPFDVGKTPDNKNISVAPKNGKWVLSVGEKESIHDDPVSCIHNGLTATRPAPKRTITSMK